MKQRSPIHFPFLAAKLCLLVLLVYLLSVSPPINLANNDLTYAVHSRNNKTDYVARVRSVREKLESINISESCAILDKDCCEARLASAVDDATPESVFKRTATCDIMWPRIEEIEQEERDFPLVLPHSALS